MNTNTANIVRVTWIDVFKTVFPNLTEENWLDYAMELTYDEECRIMQEYCKKNNCYYYGRLRGDFSEAEGYQLAAEEGCTKIYLDDLS